MFDILLTLCLAAAADQCRTERLAGGASHAECAALANRARLIASARADGDEMAVDWPCVPAGTTPDFTLTEIAPGVLVHKGAQAEAAPENAGDIANLGVVLGARSVAVVDTGGSAQVARAFLAAIRERTALPISHAIITHMHPDHALGASVFAAEGAEIIGHRRLGNALASRAATYLEAGERILGDAFSGTEIALPEEAVAETRTIDLGGRTLRLQAHPTAHTDNDLTVYDEATRTLFAGDLLFIHHLPVIDGSILGWLALAPSLAEIRAARAVPGHGPVSVLWPRAMQPQTAYLEALAAATRKAVAEGMSIGEAGETLGHRHTEGWLLVSAFGTRNALAAFKELEWE
ncbi:MAG: quinoprotein relay system zinc metallohydrolase 2 [Pseudomonadota bacterium]